jgi:hypothetical protein
LVARFKIADFRLIYSQSFKIIKNQIALIPC